MNDHPLTMEVDTGAAVSLAPESAVASLISTGELKSSNVVLKTYTGEQIPVKGTLSVNVKYGQQQHKNLKLLVVAGSGPSLMGRDWLKFVQGSSQKKIEEGWWFLDQSILFNFCGFNTFF